MLVAHGQVERPILVGGLHPTPRQLLNTREFSRSHVVAAEVDNGPGYGVTAVPFYPLQPGQQGVPVKVFHVVLGKQL